MSNIQEPCALLFVPPSPFPRNFSEHSLALFLPHAPVPVWCGRGRRKLLCGIRKDKASKARCFRGPCGGVPAVVMCCSHPEWSRLRLLVFFTLPLGSFSSTMPSSLFILVQLLGAVCTESPQPWQSTVGSWNDTGLGLSQCDSRELGWLLSNQNTALDEDGGLFSGIVGISAKEFCHHQYCNVLA